MGNESYFLAAITILLISNHDSFRELFDKALERASPWNQHCASCIGTLSFPIIGVFRKA